MTKKPFAVLALLAAAFAPTMAAAEESTGRENHGYGGGGLVLTSSSLDVPGGNEVTASGGGIIFTGAGMFNVASSLGIGVNGSFWFGQRTFDDTDEDTGDAQLAVDGGVALFDLLYLSIGIQSFAYTVDNPLGGTITTNYIVVPLGVGLFKATDSGYILAQLRFGGGEASEDYTDTEEDLGYAGIRVMGQIGAANGVQFMGGIELDDYDFKDSDITDSYFRVFAGVGFGT